MNASEIKPRYRRILLERLTGEWLNFFVILNDFYFESGGPTECCYPDAQAEADADESVEWLRVAKRESVALGETEQRGADGFVRLTEKGLAAKSALPALPSPIGTPRDMSPSA